MLPWSWEVWGARRANCNSCAGVSTEKCVIHNPSFVQHPDELSGFYCWILDGIIERLRLKNAHWFRGRVGRSTQHTKSAFFYLLCCDTESRTIVWRTKQENVQLQNTDNLNIHLQDVMGRKNSICTHRRKVHLEEVEAVQSVPSNIIDNRPSAVSQSPKIIGQGHGGWHSLLRFNPIVSALLLPNTASNALMYVRIKKRCSLSQGWSPPRCFCLGSKPSCYISWELGINSCFRGKS